MWKKFRCDSAIDYSNYKLDVRNRKTKNLEDEDVEAYFDDVVVNSDSDSESRTIFRFWWIWWSFW